ncbi:MAG: hypothetical protein HY898_22425 [Deltaproteobacteria bacterium]|nr:hypothetical protein [Deltaproteobacteria bacterium]
MDLTLEQVLSAARARRAALSPETAGYITLAVADALAVSPGTVRESDVMVNADGSVTVVGAQRTEDPAGAEKSVRALLQRLLGAAVGSAPALAGCARRSAGAGMRSLVEEIEAALIPVNREAARRAIARLARESARAGASEPPARPAGAQQREPSARAAQAPAQPAQPQAPQPAAARAPRPASTVFEAATEPEYTEARPAEPMPLPAPAQRPEPSVLPAQPQAAPAPEPVAVAAPEPIAITAAPQLPDATPTETSALSVEPTVPLSMPHLQMPEPPEPIETVQLRPLVEPAVMTEIIERPSIDESEPASLVESAELVPVAPAPEGFVESADLPPIESEQAPIVESAQAPAVVSAPAPAVESAPAPVVESAPAPEVESAPAPVVESAPAPVVERAAAAPADHHRQDPHALTPQLSTYDPRAPQWVEPPVAGSTQAKPRTQTPAPVEVVSEPTRALPIVAWPKEPTPPPPAVAAPKEPTPPPPAVAAPKEPTPPPPAVAAPKEPTPPPPAVATPKEPTPPPPAVAAPKEPTPPPPAVATPKEPTPPPPVVQEPAELSQPIDVLVVEGTPLMPTAVDLAAQKPATPPPPAAIAAAQEPPPPAAAPTEEGAPAEMSVPLDFSQLSAEPAPVEPAAPKPESEPDGAEPKPKTSQVRAREGAVEPDASEPQPQEAPKARPKKAKDEEAVREVSVKPVDDLLASFGKQEKRSSREVAGDLKKMVGLEPTPPPPDVTALSGLSLAHGIPPVREVGSDPPQPISEYRKPRAPRTAFTMVVVFLVLMLGAVAAIYNFWPAFFTGH